MRLDSRRVPRHGRSLARPFAWLRYSATATRECCFARFATAGRGRTRYRICVATVGRMEDGMLAVGAANASRKATGAGRHAPVPRLRPHLVEPHDGR